MKLTEKHLEIMESIKNGATIWGYIEAKLLREVQQYNESLVYILDISELEKVVGYEFDGAKQMPYFGAILTDAGKEFLKSLNAHYDDDMKE